MSVGSMVTLICAFLSIVLVMIVVYRLGVTDGVLQVLEEESRMLDEEMRRNAKQ